MAVVHGNRGKCAQPCRLPYELLKVQNSDIPETLDKGHLLSPRDLCSLDFLPTLVNLGITCFKIEGRLKNPEYVSTVTRIYRKYIDLAQSENPYVIDEKDRKDLLQVFNRGGFGTGYLESKPNQNLIYKNKPNNMGILIGQVYNFNGNKGYITLKLQDSLSLGDTVSLQKEKGLYTISELMINNKNVPSAQKGDIVKIGRIKGNIAVNDNIYKMSSKELTATANEFINNDVVKIKINCEITVRRNSPISMRIYADKPSHVDFIISSDLVPVEANNSPITTERIIEQIDKLGGTPFELETINVNLDDGLYVPSISKLNQLRRDCISKLEEILVNNVHRTSVNTDTTVPISDTEASEIRNGSNTNNAKQISILLNMLNADCDYTTLKNVSKIYIPLKYFFDKIYNNTITEISNNFNTYIYFPSVMKDTVINQVSANIERITTTYHIKGFVISNISQLNLLDKYREKYEFIANYNMNIYNDFTVKELEKLDVSCVTLSPELDKNCLNSFSNEIKQHLKTEAIVYGNLPVMTTNYCLLSKSNSCLQSCSSNCTNNNIEYSLKDRIGMNFKIVPDSFSRTTTIYNSKKISISPNEISVDFVRLDFLRENIEEIYEIINTYANGQILTGSEFTNGNFNRIV